MDQMKLKEPYRYRNKGGFGGANSNNVTKI